MRRDRFVSTRLTEAEDEALRRVAFDLRTTKSSLLRRLFIENMSSLAKEKVMKDEDGERQPLLDE